MLSSARVCMDCRLILLRIGGCGKDVKLGYAQSDRLERLVRSDYCELVSLCCRSLDEVEELFTIRTMVCRLPSVSHMSNVSRMSG